MKQFFTLVFFSFSILGLWGQNTIGMTINHYNNWGNSFSFSDFAKSNPDNMGLDSAAQAQTYDNSNTYNSGFMIGANYKMLSTDTSSWKSKWSRNISFYIGYGAFSNGTAYQYKISDINQPYTSILYGDTTTVILDSLTEGLHTVTPGQSYFTQIGFAMNRVIPTKTRITAEIGLGVHIGMGQFVAQYEHNRYFRYLNDSSITISHVPGTSTSYKQNMNAETYYSGQIELNAGFIFPIAKDEDSWWLSLHGALGVGGIYMMDNWYTRMTFVPSLGINFRLGQKNKPEEYQ